MKSSTSLKWGDFFLEYIIYWTESFNELKKKKKKNISILLLYWKSEEGRGAPAFPQVKRFYLRKKRRESVCKARKEMREIKGLSFMTFQRIQ